MRELLIVLVVLLWTVASADVNLAEFLGVGAALVASVAFSKSIADGIAGSSGTSRGSRGELSSALR